MHTGGREERSKCAHTMLDVCSAGNNRKSWTVQGGKHKEEHYGGATDERVRYRYRAERERGDRENNQRCTDRDFRLDGSLRSLWVCVWRLHSSSCIRPAGGLRRTTAIRTCTTSCCPCTLRCRSDSSWRTPARPGARAAAASSAPARRDSSAGADTARTA